MTGKKNARRRRVTSVLTLRPATLGTNYTINNPIGAGLSRLNLFETDVSFTIRYKWLCYNTQYMNSRSDDTITTTVQTNSRGDVRVPAEVRKALGFDGEEAVLEVEIQLKAVMDKDSNN